MKTKDTIRLNNQTVGNLKKYLDQFPNDAKVVIHNFDRTEDYRDYDCQIACDFVQQHATNTIKFLVGWMIDGTEND